MRDERVIDHLLFRKLFAVSFRGSQDDNYRIAPSGVSWKESEEEYLSQLPPFLGPTDQETVEYLEGIRAANLSFPASPAGVLKWIEAHVGTGPDVPDWLTAALSQDSSDAAMAVIRDAILDLEAEASAAASSGDDELAASVPGIREKIASAKRAVEAFVEIGKRVAKSGSMAPSPQTTIQINARTRGVGAVVDAARIGLGELNPTFPQIVAWLMKRDASEQDRLGITVKADKVLVGNRELTRKLCVDSIANVTRAKSKKTKKTSSA